MRLERRFGDYLVLFSALACFAASLALLSVYWLKSRDESNLVIRQVHTTQSWPKVKYIPTATKVSPQADISNSILGPKAKKPVVFEI